MRYNGIASWTGKKKVKTQFWAISVRVTPVSDAQYFN